MRLNGEYSLTTEDIYKIWTFKEWVHDWGRADTNPTVEDIDDLLIDLYLEAMEKGSGEFVYRSRFMAVKLPDLGTVDLFLNVGHLDIDNDVDLYVDEEDMPND